MRHAATSLKVWFGLGEIREPDLTGLQQHELSMADNENEHERTHTVKPPLDASH